jgi:3-phenylpropionate/trans-cinnamate dioxygenase ferredoxin reductase component
VTGDPRAPLDPDGRVVIVGAGLGGLRCAEALRANGFRGALTLLGEERRAPYDRPPLTKQLLAGTWDEARVTLATDDALATQGIVHRGGTSAVGLDVDGRAVTLSSGERVEADAVVLATGAAPRRLPGTEGLGAVHVIRTMDESLALRRALAEAGDAARVVVVGAGFIGAEVASTANAQGCAVTVLEALEVPLSPIVGVEVGGWITELHRRAGVEVRAATTIDAVNAGDDGHGASVVLADGEQLAADVVVVGIGVVPATGWLADSGLTVDNGVVTDAALFAADGVVALGDLARFEWRHAAGTEQVRIEHWEVTAQLAAHAATSLLAGRDAAPPVSLVPYFWSDQHGRKLQMLGRPSGDDEVELASGSLADAKFTFVYHRQGRTTGVLGVASPRQVMLCRAAVERAAPLEEALAAIRG